jgi:hypothetical protein
MKDSKFVTSTSRDHTRITLQVRSGRAVWIGHLNLGASLVLGCWCLAVFPAVAEYSIDWSTMDGGGGTSTGGVYSVNGTIGQPEAGPAMTNGQYAVMGGFWVLPTMIQTEGAPTLTIVPAGAGQAQISWLPNSASYVLQQTALLKPASWTNAPSGSTNPITVPANANARFYRLFKP